MSTCDAGAKTVLRACASCHARRVAVALLFAGALLGCGDTDAPPPGEAQDWLLLPADFPPLPAPEDNQLTRERAALGKQLFFDTRLSRTHELACAICHLQAAAFSEPKRFSVGVEGRTGTRNARTLVNLAWGTNFFWDGGVPSLELQAIGPPSTTPTGVAPGSPVVTSTWASSRSRRCATLP